MSSRPHFSIDLLDDLRYAFAFVTSQANGFGRAAGPLNRGDCFREFGDVARDAGDFGAVCGQRNRNRPAQTPRCAGDQSHLAGEIDARRVGISAMVSSRFSKCQTISGGPQAATPCTFAERSMRFISPCSTRPGPTS